MDAPSTVPQAVLDRFANRSRARCILVFIVGYLVWQPLAQLILHFFGKPLAFRTGSQWAYFLLVMGCLGGAVGAGWYTVQRLRAGWRRDWFDNSLRMVAFGSAIFGSDLATDPLGLWLIAALSSSAFVGALWVAVGRLAARLFDRDAAA